MSNATYSVAMVEELHQQLMQHLVREDREEDLIFALWTPSQGSKRLTALVHTPIFPEKDDRQRHGNASFNPQYFERVCKLAIAKESGIAFMHSHPVPGWQGMSDDDVTAEKRMMGSVAALTGLPLLGMTVGSDETWSARFWVDTDGKSYKKRWCNSVRVVGKTLKSDFNDHILPPPEFNEMFKRTVTVWGKEKHQNVARLKIGIIGLGSVGGAVAVDLARSGFTNLVFIDHDEIQRHNLDRLCFATQKDLGCLKVDVAKKYTLQCATADNLNIETIPFSVAEEQGYAEALNCDVLFCCVDRPRPRSIADHFAYAHLIPVIDGGIRVRMKNEDLIGVDWQLQTVAPSRSCLKCAGAYSSDEVAMEIEGKLDDPSYIDGLPDSHHLKRNENVFAFSQNLASLEMLQFMVLTGACIAVDDVGLQRFRFNPGILESDITRGCRSDCEMKELIATGDSLISLRGHDFGAEDARDRQLEKIS